MTDYLFGILLDEFTNILLRTLCLSSQVRLSWNFLPPPVPPAPAPGFDIMLLLNLIKLIGEYALFLCSLHEFAYDWNHLFVNALVKFIC